MPSFDISSEIDWQEMDNAINQALKEIQSRFDFKNLKATIEMDKKAKTITVWCSDARKLEAVNDVFQSKLVKRGISLHALDYKKEVEATGSSARQLINVQAGVSKEKGKEIISLIKESKLKVQSQIQDEQVRVTGKSRDDLQSVMSLLKQKQDSLKVPMQFGNFRD